MFDKEIIILNLNFNNMNNFEYFQLFDHIILIYKFILIKYY